MPEAVKLPETPQYITGNYVHSYLAACDPSVKTRFDEMCVLRGIEFPKTDDVLRTEQVELFMSAL